MIDFFINKLALVFHQVKPEEVCWNYIQMLQGASVNRLFQQLHMPADLAIEFMATFSRVEHALKSTGYVLANKGKVEPDWDRFANEIDPQFIQIEDEKLASAKNFLLITPPRKQVLKDGIVIFQNQVVDPNQRVTHQLLRFVRTVRNNLFHGGKYLPTGELEPGRNEALVNASLCIIHSCIELNERVKQSYDH